MKYKKPILSLGGFVVAAILAFSLLYAGGAFPASAASAQQAAETPSATANPIVVTAQGGTLADFQSQLIQMYNQVNNSVVSINTLATQQQTSFFPQTTQQAGQGALTPLAAGSGVVWDNQGHIVTNNHVIEGAQKIIVNFQDGTSATATVVGTDPQSDLAVLSVNVPANQLHPIDQGSMSQVQVGDLAFALGNPYGLGTSISFGMVSAMGRSLPAGNGTSGNGLNGNGDGNGTANYTIPDVIQTSAPINPGNSGGALVNINGQMIGIPTANISASGASSGVGFAIPISLVKLEVPSLIQNGNYQHPYLGIEGTTLTAGIAQQMGLSTNQNGALVVNIAPGSPAAQAGLTGGNQTVTVNGQQVQIGGDVITAINGNQIKNMEGLISYLDLHTHVGDTVTLTVLQNGQTQQVQATLASRPSLPSTGGTGQQNGVVLGVQVAPVTPLLIQQYNLPQGTAGLFVGAILPGYPAAQAGIQQGDVITAFNGHNITSLPELRNQLDQLQPGQTATITILRNGQTKQLTVHFQQAQPAVPGQEPTGTQSAPFFSTTNTPVAPLSSATSTPVAPFPSTTNTPAAPFFAPTNTPTAQAGIQSAQQSLLGFRTTIVGSNTTALSLGLPAATRGLYIDSIQPGSLAAQSRLQNGDVIYGVNGQPVYNLQDLYQLIQNATPGQQVTLDVLRNGNTVQIPLNLSF